MKKSLLLFALIFTSVIASVGQQVTIINKKFVVNGNASCPIYFNGANTPWDNWNDFGGNYDAAFWSAHFATLKANGINATRVWISCNGDVQPNINTDGTVTGVSTQFWANVDDFFQSAKNNGIYVMATMMSFDHTKNTYTKYQSWRNMLNDQAKVQSYCDNYLVPFVNRYKTNPYLMSIDISNEIEWVAEDANNMKCSYAVLQRFVAMCASAIHNNPRTDGTSVLVTMGSAATKWNATKMRIGQNGAWSQNNSDGNKWSDAALKAQYNQANAVLDFYSPHYYAWIDGYYSNPYVRTPSDFGMDEKAVLIGETPAGNPGTPNLTPLASYEALKNNGYQGHFPWTSNSVDSNGGIEKFGTDAKTFSTTYSALVKPTCAVACTTPAPTVTTPVVYCKNASAVALTATGTALKWYTDNTTTTAFSTTPIPSTTVAGTTSYYVSQTLNGCEGTRAAVQVTVKELPAATITTTTATTFCAGGSVSLAANTGTGLTYVWKKDNTTITGATASTYPAATAGSYTVTVTSNNCSETSAAKVVTVNALPAATITTTTATTFCAGGSVSLAANTGTGLTYVWKKDNTTITGATASTYPAATAGSYTVTVTSNNCSETSAAKVVTVNALPAATITTTTATTFCAGGSVSLAANAGAGLTYVWKKDNTTITGATASTYPAATAGSYTVTVTSNNCSEISAAKVVTVNALPAATITTTTATTFCAGGSVSLAANTGTGLTYVWKKDNTTITGATASTYPAATAGSYTVTVTSNNCSETSAAKVVTVNALPAATITTTTATTFCAGGSVSLAANTGAGLTYVWKKDNTTITGATASTYPAATAGSYTVTVTSNNCSEISAAKVVTVNALPAATITTTTPTTFCAGGSVNLAANTGAGLTYVWKKDNTTITGATASTYPAAIAGSYTVTVTSNNCSETSAAKVVTVTAATTWYQDLDGDGKGNAAVTQTACTQPAGYVSVAGDACPSDPDKLIAGDCGCGIAEGTCTDCAGVINGKAARDVCNVCSGGTTGINPITDISQCGPVTAIENSLSADLHLYPNPYETELYIEAGTGEFMIVVYNNSGLEVLRGTYESQALIGAGLAPGIYLIRIEKNGLTETRKIIKK
ncbi:T9SS type A sorting domain-containing protein [Cytophaga hutchinsonii]|uniref:CHU large protein candidate retaining b-glycosidase, glycoside hydrolase family 5 protein n=2 Tax=Cytophaga hutchinsonii TaxID=985 RepID=A0A6N4SSR4_CYTH3|nr:T9SS type A sorting domain-containing protein [Cytophaga hutchinsonii]ABG59412.1 CHU large protein; candidate retaining b-glycosidase, glycoside hydrolase family 5 protein [Cytophaga hutchinsonii ATCC 33406]